MDNKQHIIESTNKISNNFLHQIKKLSIDPGKAVLVHPSILIKDEAYLFSMLEFVIEQLNTRGWDCKVVFYHPSEGFFINQMKFYDKIAKHLVINYSFPLCNLLYVTGAAKTKTNLRLYHKYCAEFNMLPVTLIHSATFEEDYEISSDKLFKKEIKKKFMCLNGRPKPHRVAIISEIFKRNLEQHCFLSLSLKDNEIPINYSKVELFFSTEQVMSMKQHLDTIQLPINLTLEADNSNMHRPNDNDIELYNSSLFSLVNETIFFNEPKYYNDPNYYDTMMCYPGAFFTEKTWKCVNLKHPFILCTTPNALSEFRELGYKTFHPYINESYDTIDNETDRITAIMDEVERLCNMNDSETKEWLANVSKICEYNYKVLASKPIAEIKFAE